MDYLGGPSVITGSLNREEGGRESEQGDGTVKKLNWSLLALKMVGSDDPRKAGGLQKLGKQGSGFSLGASRGMRPANSLILA